MLVSRKQGSYEALRINPADKMGTLRPEAGMTLRIKNCLKVRRRRSVPARGRRLAPTWPGGKRAGCRNHCDHLGGKIRLGGGPRATERMVRSRGHGVRERPKWGLPRQVGPQSPKTCPRIWAF